MITDEQVKAAVSTYHDAYHHHPQIMADMRKALEAVEQLKPKPEPLSEEKIEKLVPWQGDSKDPFFSRIEFARAIEKAHGIT